MNTTRSLLFAALFALLISACSQPRELTNSVLEPQFGTRGFDYTDSPALNQAGHLYVGGRLDSSSDTLGGDPFLRRYDRAGSLRWETYLDMTNAIDGSSFRTGVATDVTGNAYVTWTYGVEGSGSQANLAKYTSGGTLVWRKSLPATLIVALIVLDRSGNLYTVSGPNGPSLITKYTPAGTQLWQRSVASPTWYLATTQNYLYALRLDGYLLKYTLDGTRVWTKRLPLDQGTRPRGIRAGINDEVFVVGEVAVGEEGSGACGSDEYLYTVYKLGGSGTLLWKTQVTAQPVNRCIGVTIDTYGNAYFLSNPRNSTTLDINVSVTKYSGSGTHRWSRSFGTAQDDVGRDLVTYDGSAVFVGGWTYGALAHRNLGNSDAFLRKLDATGSTVWTR